MTQRWSRYGSIDSRNGSRCSCICRGVKEPMSSGIDVPSTEAVSFDACRRTRMSRRSRKTSRLTASQTTTSKPVDGAAGAMRRGAVEQKNDSRRSRRRR